MGLALPAVGRRAGARASWSPRPSAGGATGSTRSSTASRPTLPWGLEIDAQHRQSLAPQYQKFETFHPTFLYEFVWNLGVAGLVIWADRRFRLGHGRAFALYVMAYTAGRGWIEYLRIDAVEANDVFGLRLNVWTSIIVFLLAAAYFVVVGRIRQGREETVWREAGPDEPAPTPSEDAGPGAGQGQVSLSFDEIASSDR